MLFPLLYVSREGQIPSWPIVPGRLHKASIVLLSRDLLERNHTIARLVGKVIVLRLYWAGFVVLLVELCLGIN